MLRLVQIPSVFELGQVVATRAVLGWAARLDLDLTPYLLRHARADWGDLCESDAQQNDLALETGEGRIFSAYKIPQAKNESIWIITDDGNEVTTILLPSDY